MNYLLPIDALSLILLWWAAQAALAGGRPVETWSDILLTCGLIGVQVFGFVGAAVVIVETVPSLSWWQRGLLWSFAAMALWFYEYRFGIARHIRMYFRAVRELPADLRAFFHDTRERLHGRPPAKRKPHV